MNRQIIVAKTNDDPARLRAPPEDRDISTTLGMTLRAYKKDATPGRGPGRI